MSQRLDGILLYQKRSTFVSPKIHVHECRGGRRRPSLHRCLIIIIIIIIIMITIIIVIINRHDKAVSDLQWNICSELNINVEGKWYEHEPQTVTETHNITILWDMSIQTNREIKANRPDVVIKDKQETSKSRLSECGG